MARIVPETWAPLTEGVIDVLGRPVGLNVVDCGRLAVPSGRLLWCDLFSELEVAGRVIPVPPGAYPVRLTIADVSGRLDGSHLAEAYLSLLLADDEPEASHRTLAAEGDADEPDQAELAGLELDGDTVAVADADAFDQLMPDPEEWEDEVFDGGEAPWYEQLDDPEMIREGAANVGLPRATGGENAILCRTSQGEGRYPLLGSFSATGRLLAVHLDFLVFG